MKNFLQRMDYIESYMATHKSIEFLKNFFLGLTL